MREEEFKKNYPNLHKAFEESMKSRIKVYIYGMPFLVRPDSYDYYGILESIDNRTPLYAYDICKDEHGRIRRELFFPN